MKKYRNQKRKKKYKGTKTRIHDFLQSFHIEKKKRTIVLDKTENKNSNMTKGRKRIKHTQLIE